MVQFNSRPLSLLFTLKLPCTLINSHSLSKSLNSCPLSLSFALKLSWTLKEFELSSSLALIYPQTLTHSQRVWTLIHSRSYLPSNSHALSKSFNSCPLSLSFGLKLSCTLINSNALSKSLNSRPLSLSFGLKLSCTLINSHAPSESLNSRPLSLSFGL